MNDSTFIHAHVIDEEILVIQLHGKLDNSTVEAFNQEIDRQFDTGVRKIIVDCSHLGYVSSFGIGSLVRAQSKLRNKGGEMKLATVQSMVANVFKIVHLDRLLDIYDDIEFARKSFYE